MVLFTVIIVDLGEDTSAVQNPATKQIDAHEAISCSLPPCAAPRMIELVPL